MPLLRHRRLAVRRWLPVRKVVVSG